MQSTNKPTTTTALLLVVIIGFLASSSNSLPARKRMIYYQHPSSWYSMHPQERMMYVQYVQPSSTHQRSAQAAEVLVAGESVASGTYLEDCNHAAADVSAAGPALSISSNTQTQLQDEDVLSAAGAHGAHSIAEAYPDNTDVFKTVDVPPPPPPQSDSHTVVEDEATVPDAGEAAIDLPIDTADANEPSNPSDGVSIAATLPESGDEAKKPRDFNFESNLSTNNNVDHTPEEAPVPEQVPHQQPEPVAAAAPAEPAAAELPAPKPLAPAIPSRRYLPAKKVFVELDHSSVEETALNTVDDDDDESDHSVAVAQEPNDNDAEEDETDVAPIAPKHAARIPNAHRPSVKRPIKPDCAICAKTATTNDCCGRAAGNSKPQPKPPVGTFFPISFGGTAGGAIAIANSFSTGEGGSATSHAIAYGSPEAARAHSRLRPSKLH